MELLPSAIARNMALQSQEILNRIFLELKSKNDDVRLRAAFDLHSHVSTAARGRTLAVSKQMFRLLTAVQNFQLTNSTNTTQTSTIESHNSSRRAMIQRKRSAGFWQLSSSSALTAMMQLRRLQDFRATSVLLSEAMTIPFSCLQQELWVI